MWLWLSTGEVICMLVCWAAWRTVCLDISVLVSLSGDQPYGQSGGESAVWSISWSFVSCLLVNRSVCRLDL